jgi:hypothetical protein
LFAHKVGLVNSFVMLHSRVPLPAGELATVSGLSRQVATSALIGLEKRGLVTRARAGKRDVFGPNTASPYYPAAYLTALVDLPIAETLAPHRAMAACVYGSMATPGLATPRSDIDLLLVGDFPDKPAVREALDRLGERLERRIDAYLLSPEEVESGRREGDEHVLAAVAGVRLFGEA